LRGQGLPSVPHKELPEAPIPQMVNPSVEPLNPTWVSSRNVPKRSTWGFWYTRHLLRLVSYRAARPAGLRPPWPQRSVISDFCSDACTTLAESSRARNHNSACNVK
jgi:hypothetical protein